MNISIRIFCALLLSTVVISLPVLSASSAALSQARHERDTQVENDLKIAIAHAYRAAQSFFEQYWPNVVVDDEALFYLIRHIEREKHQWLKNPTKPIAARPITYQRLIPSEQSDSDSAAASASSSRTYSPDGIKQMVWIDFDIIGTEVFLKFPHDFLGEGNFGIFKKRTHYPSFRACALGEPRRGATPAEDEASLRAFRRQYDIYRYLGRQATPELWQFVLRPYTVASNWIILPLMDTELISMLERDDLEQIPGVNSAQRLDFASATSYAVKLLHDYGVAHNDTKPDNIFLLWIGNRYVVFLGDLNLSTIPALLISRGAARPPLGSPEYAAPEIWIGASWGEGDLAARVERALKSDVFSLGMTVFATIFLKFPPFMTFKSWRNMAKSQEGAQDIKPYCDVLIENLERYFENLWRVEERPRRDYLFAASFRIDADERINADRFFRAWQYVRRRPNRNAASSSQGFTAAVAHERFASFAYKIWDVDDKAAEAMLANAEPGAFILRLVPSDDPRFKASVVLPRDEQRIVKKHTQHIYLDRALDEPGRMAAELKFFGDLQLLTHEFRESPSASATAAASE